MKAKVTILTREERDVLVLAAPHLCGQHLNNAEIGRCLDISAGRVKTLIHQTCIKLEAHNRYEAIYIALRRGLIGLNEIYMCDELAELFSAFCPNTWRRITHLVRQGLEVGQVPCRGEQIIRTARRQDTILTKREQEVLALVARGLTNTEIADTLYMSTSAVRTFLYRACTKLGAHNRAGAFVLALERGEINPHEVYTFNELVQLLAPLGAEYLEKIAQQLSQRRRQEPVPTSS
jgi:DNA-binding NarL/FixJ family response regulator